MGILLVVTLVLSCWATGYLRQYALAKKILDVPNHRSSHILPTPRGGGVAFVVVFLMALPYLFYSNFLSLKVFFIFLSAGTVIAGVGFVDDRRHIPAVWRLLAHLCVSTVALSVLGGMPDIEIGSLMLPSGVILNVLALLYLSWLINLYNFMDGINGIASIEAITACISGACLYWITGHADAMVLPLTLACSVAGFIIWNFPSAKIFMGDAGSGFLGFALGLFSIQAAWINTNLFYSWLILLGIFIVDATITLLRRLLHGDKLHEAHKDHAYQQAAQFCQSHTPVTLAVLAINLIWLFPIAVMVGLGLLSGFIGLLIAYLPLILLTLYFGASKVPANYKV